MKQYEKYKPSGIEWIGEIPNHWEILPLRRITEEHRQGYYISGEYINEGVKLIRITDLQVDGTIKYAEMPFVKISETDEKTFQVKNGDFLFPRTGSIGLLGVVNNPERAVFASYLINFRFQKKVKSNFLKYYFSSQCFKIGIETDLHGGVNKNIHAENIKNQVIAIPSIEEQTTIANFLDEKTTQIDKLISKKQKLIELLKEERTTIINEVVNGKGKNWERKKLKYVAKLRDELIDNSDFKIAVENIESASGRLVNMQEEKNYEGQLSAFEKGDTIFNKLRPYLHKVYLAEKEGGLYGELLILYSTGELIPEFLFFKLFSKTFIDIVDGSTQGTKMPRANWNGFISQLLISFPKDKREQTMIVQHIQAETQRIVNTISKIEKEIELMNEYKTALISEVVTGKIKVA